MRETDNMKPDTRNSSHTLDCRKFCGFENNLLLLPSFVLFQKNIHLTKDSWHKPVEVLFFSPLPLNHVAPEWMSVVNSVEGTKQETGGHWNQEMQQDSAASESVASRLRFPIRYVSWWLLFNHTSLSFTSRLLFSWISSLHERSYISGSWENHADQEEEHPVPLIFISYPLLSFASSSSSSWSSSYSTLKTRIKWPLMVFLLLYSWWSGRKCLLLLFPLSLPSCSSLFLVIIIDEDDVIVKRKESWTKKSMKIKTCVRKGRRGISLSYTLHDTWYKSREKS